MIIFKNELIDINTFLVETTSALMSSVLKQSYTGLTLGLRPANERRRYTVTPSLIGWAQT